MTNDDHLPCNTPDLTLSDSEEDDPSNYYIEAKKAVALVVASKPAFAVEPSMVLRIPPVKKTQKRNSSNRGKTAVRQVLPVPAGVDDKKKMNTKTVTNRGSAGKGKGLKIKKRIQKNQANYQNPKYQRAEKNCSR